MQPTQVVLMAFYDPASKSVLSELRSPDHPFYPNQKTFPAGKLDPADNSNPETALFREAQEEFGVKPTKFAPLTSEPIYVKKTNVLLSPFIILEWEGTLPQTVLDKGTKLIWETLTEVSRSPIFTRPIVASLIEKYLARAATDTTITSYNDYAQEYKEEVEEFWRLFPKTTLESFRKNLKGKKILDLGSGPGYDAILLRDTGLDVLCIDGSASMVKITEKLGFASLEKKFSELELGTESFDGVWAYTSLLHVSQNEMKETVKNIHRWLKKDGIFLIGMIEGEFEGEKTGLGIANKNAHRYFKFYNEENLEKIISPLGFRKIFQEKYKPYSKTYIHQLYRKLHHPIP